MTSHRLHDPSPLNTLKRILASMGVVELTLSVIFVFFISITIVVGVFFRYVLGSSLVFVEEAVTISFIWITFLGAAVAAKMRRHIVITTLSIFRGAKSRIYTSIFCDVFVLLVAITVCVFAIRYIEPQNRSLTVSLPVNFPRGWVFSIPTLIAMASIALTQLAYLMDSVVRLRNPGQDREPMKILGG